MKKISSVACIIALILINGCARINISSRSATKPDEVLTTDKGLKYFLPYKTLRFNYTYSIVQKTIYTITEITKYKIRVVANKKDTARIDRTVDYSSKNSFEPGTFAIGDSFSLIPEYRPDYSQPFIITFNKSNGPIKRDFGVKLDPETQFVTSINGRAESKAPEIIEGSFGIITGLVNLAGQVISIATNKALPASSTKGFPAKMNDTILNDSNTLTRDSIVFSRKYFSCSQAIDFKNSTDVTVEVMKEIFADASVVQPRLTFSLSDISCLKLDIKCVGNSEAISSPQPSNKGIYYKVPRALTLTIKLKNMLPGIPEFSVWDGNVLFPQFGPLSTVSTESWAGGLNSISLSFSKDGALLSDSISLDEKVSGSLKKAGEGLSNVANALDSLRKLQFQAIRDNYSLQSDIMKSKQTMAEDSYKSSATMLQTKLDILQLQMKIDSLNTAVAHKK